MSRGLWVLVGIICLCIGVPKLLHRPVRYAPGVRSRLAPLQTPATQEPFKMGGFTITPLADYDIRARVLDTQRYGYGTEAELSPIDFCVGWSSASDQANIDQMNISISDRYATFMPKGQMTFDIADVADLIANMHLIPETDLVKGELLRVKVGQFVRLQGWLVEIHRPDGWHWKSSLTREDSGNGACEVMVVRSCDVFDPNSESSRP